MSQMINRGKEIIRIDPKNSKKIQYSTNQGRGWGVRFTSSSFEFQDLTDGGKEILATTTKGLYYSINEGRGWGRRS